MKGLGYPSVSAYIVDRVTTTLDLSVAAAGPGEVRLTAINKTIFGKNPTELTLFAPEVGK